MTTLAKIFVVLIAIVSAQICQAQCSRPSPLKRRIEHFHVGTTSVLNALFWLGHDTGVCFGLEYSGLDLNNRVRIDENEATVAELLGTILGASYQISISEGVVLIRKKDISPPNWLNQKLPEFTMSKAELMMTDARLWMEFELSLDNRKQGFGGDSPESNPLDEIGPFSERNKTIRELLVKIVSSSHGAAWFPTNRLLQTSFDASVNRFWTLATYSTRNLFRPE